MNYIYIINFKKENALEPAQQLIETRISKNSILTFDRRKEAQRKGRKRKKRNLVKGKRAIPLSAQTSNVPPHPR